MESYGASKHSHLALAAVSFTSHFIHLFPYLSLPFLSTKSVMEEKMECLVAIGAIQLEAQQLHSLEHCSYRSVRTIRHV